MFGHYVAQKMRDKKLSVDAVARHLGVSTVALGRLTTGDHVLAGEHIEKLGRLLGEDLEDFRRAARVARVMVERKRERERQEREV